MARRLTPEETARLPPASAANQDLVAALQSVVQLSGSVEADRLDELMRATSELLTEADRRIAALQRALFQGELGLDALAWRKQTAQEGDSVGAG